MDEKKLLEKIRQSAENAEIPESLQPEQIRKRLEETARTDQRKRQEKRQKKWQRRAAGLTGLAAVLVLTLAVGGRYEQMKKMGSPVQEESVEQEPAVQDAREESAEQEPAVQDAQEERVQEETQEKSSAKGFTIAESEEELFERLKAKAVREYLTEGITPYSAKSGTGSSSSGAGVNEIMMEDSVMDMGAETQTAGAASDTQDYSDTNVREAGVDEGDVVKTDGKYLYILKTDSSIKIVDIQKEEMELTAVIEPQELDGSIRELYVDGDRLCLVTSGYRSSMEESGEDRYVVYDNPYTCLETYDISDRTSPVLLGSMEQDGWYTTSRKVGNYLYLLTEYTPDVRDILEDSRIMPLVGGTAMEAENIYLPDAMNSTQYLVVSSVDLESPGRTEDSKAILSGTSEFYMSKENLYICNYRWKSEKEYTQILKFGYQDGKITAIGTADVPGYINDSFSLDEYNGYLRVLTTDNHDQETNQLLILNEKMETVGRLEDVAQGETLRAARYFGDLVYFVTFMQTDPLFCADLSDPANPRILGELKISGFSSYLHPFGANRLLGIGYEANEKTGAQTGIKLSMFDITNPDKVKEQNKLVIDDAGYLPLDYNYRAVTVDAQKNLIGFVCDTNYLVFRYEEGKGFENLLTFHLDRENYWAGQENCRGVYVGDRFYIVDTDRIYEFDMKEEFALTDRLEL